MLLTPLVSGDSSCSAGVDPPSSLSGHPMIRPPATEEPPRLRPGASGRGAPPSPGRPPHTLPPAAVRCPSHPSSSSPSSPHGPLTSHVLTHLIEGFVIQEGLEPFPVICSGKFIILLNLKINISNFRPDSTIRMSTCSQTFCFFFFCTGGSILPRKKEAGFTS